MEDGKGVGRFTFLGWASLLVAAGCSSGISAGEEGDTINLSRCWGVDCGASAQAINGGDSAAEACTAGGRELQDLVDFEPFDATGFRYSVNELRTGPDGSFWLLATSYEQMPNDGEPEPALIHYTSEGELVGVIDPIASAEQYTSMDYTLGVDSAGNAVVALYTVYAPNADAELIERMYLYSYDQQLQPIGERIAFSGASPGLLVSDGAGGLVFAGNAMDNAQRGVLTRLIDREPSFVQTNVPSGGISTTGVCGLQVTEDGTLAVLSQRVPRSENGNGPYKFGLSTFDRDGKPLADLRLPGEFESGSRGALAGSGDTFVVMNQNIPDTTQGAYVPTALVRGFTKQGEIEWAFQVNSGWPNTLVDAETGRAFIDTWGGIAVIESDGSSCEVFAAKDADGFGRHGDGAIAVRGQHVYTASNNGLSRYTLPSE
jgi:hypothetical protein